MTTGFMMATKSSARQDSVVKTTGYFAAWLKAARAKKGWSGERLAGEIGTSQGTISMYERGLRHPHRERAVKMAEILGADPREALGALMIDTPGVIATTGASTSASDLYELILSLAPEDRETMRHVGQRLAQGRALR